MYIASVLYKTNVWVHSNVFPQYAKTKLSLYYFHSSVNQDLSVLSCYIHIYNNDMAISRIMLDNMVLILYLFVHFWIKV